MPSFERDKVVPRAAKRSRMAEFVLGQEGAMLRQLCCIYAPCDVGIWSLVLVFKVNGVRG
jgi:hypothetical protein